MAPHNHPVHLNRLHLSFLNLYGDKNSQERHIVLAFNCLLQNIPPEKSKNLDIYSVVTGSPLVSDVGTNTLGNQRVKFERRVKSYGHFS